MDITIRDATVEDTAFIARIVLDALDIKDEPSAGLVEVCADADTLYSWKNTRILCVNGRPAGGLISYPGNDYLKMRENTWLRCWDDGASAITANEPECAVGEYYLDSMVINPDYRKMGLGKLLLLDAVSIGKQKGCALIHLLVDKGKTGLFRYYENIGFKIYDSMFFFGHDYWRMRYAY